MGVLRIVAEDHWMTDILGSYFEGVLELYIIIVVFRWTTECPVSAQAVMEYSCVIQVRV